MLTRPSDRKLSGVFAKFEGVVGSSWVLTAAADLEPYFDPFGPGARDEFAPAGAVLPANVEEVQAIVRIANEEQVPLWITSQGKNLAYGGPAPRVPGCLVLNLRRMNRILEINEELGYALLEPGVTFFELRQHILDNDIKLWISGPALGWGSVVGNALERGFGYTPYGDHAAQVCGMEVVLPNGELLRTGMGAIEGSSSWQLSKNGFGPSVDGLFMQSSLGVVTKMGLWLMPEPEGYLTCTVKLDHPEDLEAAIEILRPLRMNDTIQNNAVIANVIRMAAAQTTRDQWYDGPGAIPDDVIRQMMAKLDLGYWNVRFSAYGAQEILDARLKILRKAFEKIPSARFSHKQYAKGEEIAGPDRSQAGVPSLGAMQIINWRGGRGGHTDISPISPITGRDAMVQYRMVRSRAEEYGFDYYGGFTASPRYLNHIFVIIYDTLKHEEMAKARELGTRLVREAGAAGYGKYRTHLAFMDVVADQYAFNNHALRRFNETLKDTLDPNGILSPGKQGVWPKRYRKPS
jgi:4-cresol dehydrogenase (hydroxylating)